MYLLGGTLTKLVATLTALMTVTAGLPLSQCRCPDGRIKLFCQGTASSESGCCCASSCSSGGAARPCCCGGKKTAPSQPKATGKRPCCAHAREESKKSPEHRGTQLVVKASCCVKTVVAQAPAFSAEKTSVSVHFSGDLLAFWQPVAIPQLVISATRAARPPPSSLLEPPDINLLLCRFLC